jgi:putative ABC transport system substrate-binding protein
MRRRDFIGLVGGAATWPRAARAQQSAKLPIVGYLGSTTPSAAGQWIGPYVQRLAELGWIDGRTVALEYRWAEGRDERFAEIAAELVGFKVDVILAHGTQAAIAAKKATTVIPIVGTLLGDPIGTGIVASLARPGGNVTGLSVLTPELAAKRIELVREVAPSLRRLAILANISNPAAVLDTRQVQATARALGLEVTSFEIARAGDITSTFDVLKSRAEVLYVTGDPLLTSNRVRISLLAAGAHLPTVCALREFVEAGGLMSYGPNYPDLYRRAADLVDKILRGTKPGDIPVEQPIKFDFAINLTTAKAIGLTISETLLARADEIIE